LIIEENDDHRFEKISSLLHRTDGLITANNNSLTHQEKEMEVLFSRMLKRSKKFNPAYDKRFHKYEHMKKLIDE